MLLGEDHADWELVAICMLLLVYTLEIEDFRQVDGNQSEIDLSKSLSQADPLASAEWYKGVRIPFLAIWSEEERTLGIKPFRQELTRSLPLR